MNADICHLLRPYSGKAFWKGGDDGCDCMAHGTRIITTQYHHGDTFEGFYPGGGRRWNEFAQNFGGSSGKLGEDRGRRIGN